MNITQNFYDNLAPQYDKLFEDWKSATQEQAEILDRIFTEYGFSHDAHVLDCACGIGTQSVGLARLQYPVAASDISSGALAEARNRAVKNGVDIRFEQADFCSLQNTFEEQFEIVIAMDNALPHMLSEESLNMAVRSIFSAVCPDGIFVASIRDYDRLLEEKPPYSPPYIHRTDKGQRISFQTWEWDGNIYQLTQYIIEDEDTLHTSKYQCKYRATRRDELTNMLLSSGFSEVAWKFIDETGFYQPIVVAKK